MISLIRKNWPLLSIVVATVIAWPGSSIGSESDPESGIVPFKDLDCVCFVGDEITQQGRYHEWIELFYLTRYPGERVRFVNCGVTGDTTVAAIKRVDWDVLAARPTVVSLLFGVNDLNPTLYEPGLGGLEIEDSRKERIVAFKENTRKIVDLLQDQGVRVILMSPIPYDESTRGERTALVGINAGLASMASFLRELAQERNLLFVDLFGELSEIIREQRKSDPTFSLVGPDRKQPNDAGHFLIAHQFLKATGVSGDVSRLAIDLTTGMVTEAVNGRVESVFRSTDRLTFTWTERALPFPQDDAIKPAMAIVPFQKTMNRQILRVIGLEPGIYELEIDGVRVRLFSATELDAGVNLATEEATPQYGQSILVKRLVTVRTGLVQDNLRSLAWTEHALGPDLKHPIEWSDIRPLLEARMDEISAGKSGPGPPERMVTLYPKKKASEAESWVEINRLAQQARQAAIPRSHLYSLRVVR